MKRGSGGGPEQLGQLRDHGRQPRGGRPGLASGVCPWGPPRSDDLAAVVAHEPSEQATVFRASDGVALRILCDLAQAPRASAVQGSKPNA